MVKYLTLGGLEYFKQKLLALFDVTVADVVSKLEEEEQA